MSAASPLPIRRSILERYLAISLAHAEPGDETSTDNLAWMCRTAIESLDAFPADKVCRWMGYVRGTLAMKAIASGPSLADMSGEAQTGMGSPLLMHAHSTLFARYRDIAQAHAEPGSPTANDALVASAVASLGRVGSMPITLLSEELGYVQGCLAYKGLVTVKGERDFSRPLFHAAYAEHGTVPPTLERPA